MRSYKLFALMLVVMGCSNQADPAPQSQKVENSEIIIRHLRRRIQGLTQEIEDNQNKCLEEQNAMLRGKRVSHSFDPQRGLDRMAQNLLDGEAAIEEHNRQHPEHPYADVKDLLRQMCGDCKQERAKRNSQLQQEARDGGF